MNAKKEIKQLADYLVRHLKKAGFVVQRYNSYTTNSVYLKLDYGVCNSIRISDHRGKKHLKYRYNIEVGRPGFEMKYEDFLPRYFYTPSMAKRMIESIVQDRNQKMGRYGKNRYYYYMKQNKEDGENKPGFWQQSVEV